MTFWFNKTNIDANFVNWIIDDAGAYTIELQPNRIKGTGEIRCGIYWLIMMEARETTNHIRYTRFIIYYYCIDLFFFSLLLYCIRRVNIAGNNDIDRNNISNGVMTAITGYKWALIHWHLNEFYQHRNCVGRGKKKEKMLNASLIVISWHCWEEEHTLLWKASILGISSNMNNFLFFYRDQ